MVPHDNSEESPQLSSCIERHDGTERPVVSAAFSQNLRRVDFQDVFLFVAVRSLTADSSLLQPMGWCEHHTSHRPFFMQ